MNDEAEILRLVGLALGLSPAAVHKGLTSEDVPAWDSLAHITLVGLLEEHLGTRFHENEIAELVSIEAILATMARRARGDCDN
ncbi:MAG: acyl carrier protein [Candidatus Schekmanbacteria bacterium]|nr:acyl carrier protein [Candidatus Schekmanbacteria bacterium]